MTDRPIDADVAPGVEIAEKGADFERKVGEAAGVRNRPTGLAALPRRPARAGSRKRG